MILSIFFGVIFTIVIYVVLPKDIPYSTVDDKTNSLVSTSSNKFESISKLKELLDSNAITQQEYDLEKEKLLK